jgi:hypothetical protein
MGFLKSLLSFFGFGETNKKNSEISSSEEVVSPKIETVVEESVEFGVDEEKNVETNIETVKEIKSNSKKNKTESPSEVKDKPRRPRRMEMGALKIRH